MKKNRTITQDIQAFTLIELVIVLAIVGILAAVAITQMPDTLSLRVNQVAFKIQSDIRFAQRLAMQLQRRTAIIFDVATDSYSIYIENTYGANDWSENAKAINPLTQQDFDVQLNVDEFVGVDILRVRFNGAGYALMFDRNGNPYGMMPTSPFTATPLSNPAGVVLNRRKFIMVQQATGRVYIRDMFLIKKVSAIPSPLPL